MRFLKNMCTLVVALLEKKARKWLLGIGGWDNPEIITAMDIYEDEFWDSYRRSVKKKMQQLKPGMLVRFDNSRYNGFNDFAKPERVGLLIAVDISKGQRRLRRAENCACEILWDDGTYQRVDITLIIPAGKRNENSDR